MTIPSGTKFGRYEIRSKICEGGMGEVYRARDLQLGRDVAVKVLASNYSFDEERLRRFEQEARAASALNHPNILIVHDVGSHDGSPYLVSDYWKVKPCASESAAHHWPNVEPSRSPWRLPVGWRQRIRKESSTEI
jgi:hypothetical protein